MPRINVLLIGAQKAGTTSIYDWLGQHPEIDAPPEIKDYHFFCNDRLFKKGVTHLEGFYRKSKGINLHCAVNYLYFDQLVPKRIYSYNPGAKIIICLRDPVERALSAYKYFVRTAREDNSLPEAIMAELNGQLLSFEERANNSYIGHGKYAGQIRAVADCFPASQIHYVIFERLVCQEQRKAELNGVLKFMGVKEIEYDIKYRHLNNSSEPRIRWLNSLLRARAVVKIVSAFVPRKIRRRIKSSIEEKNSSARKIRVEIAEGDIDVLRCELNKEKGLTEKLVGKNLDGIWQ